MQVWHVLYTTGLLPARPLMHNKYMPVWLEFSSRLSLLIAIACSLIILVDILSGNRQRMWIMNAVWPLTALYGGLLALLVYYTLGRSTSGRNRQQHEERHHDSQPAARPFWQSVLLGTTHCGSGCTLGDIIAEWFLYLVPVTLFGTQLLMAWSMDYILAFIFGVAFQYFTIMPMRAVSVKQGLLAAIKADVLSLTAWQIGMYGWMAITFFVIFGHEIPKNDPVFWFMMQIAMLAGFITSYPVNWWLIKNGIKETM